MHVNKGIKVKKCIALQTRKGYNIRNHTYDDLSKCNQNLALAYKNAFPNIIHRTKVTGYYNCFGLAFASRRCFIEDDINKILEDDNYIEIKEYDNVLPGDIIIYLDFNNDIIHCGVVIQEPNEENVWNPLVYSKWGVFSEIIHRANSCPYSNNTKEKKYFRIFE
jgi:hypothetical protein